VWETFTVPPRATSGVRLKLSWGPWCRRVDVVADPMSSVVLAHGKALDGHSVPLVVEVEPDSVLFFGAGSLPSADVTMNISADWTLHAAALAPADSMVARLRLILAGSGRSLDEVAEYLGVDSQTLGDLLRFHRKTGLDGRTRWTDTIQ
jgi:hypothetical protein